MRLHKIKCWKCRHKNNISKIIESKEYIEIPYDDKTCIIVVELDGLNVGLIVDCVREITTVLPTDTCSAPDFRSVNENQYIQSIIDSNGEIKQLLDIHKLILE